LWRMRQQVHFCTSFDGTRIAYAVTGDGPPLVRAPHWFTHLEHDWTNPALKTWVEDLSKRYAYLRFDQRGCGLSDREVSEISPEAHVRDLEAAVDAAGLERFAIFGASQGAAFAIAYAARHPDRVSHLILWGGFARGWAKRDPATVAEHETQTRLIELGWDSAESSYRQVFATQFMPDADLDAIRAFNDMLPLTSSARNAAKIYLTNGVIDVQAEARQVRCPALVVHGTRDVNVRFEEGRLVAGLIPGARFVSLDTRIHLMPPGDPAWPKLLDAIVEFYPPARPAHAVAGFPQLTARERDVLELIAQGLDNAQIAARLALSEKTVRNNITHIFDKIQVENRSQAIVLARQRGLGQQSRQS
jgi:pimeloyl-ACP methyl ester carboxylesterase/DNA-binding CsgD family transcriptional regulator